MKLRISFEEGKRRKNYLISDSVSKKQSLLEESTTILEDIEVKRRSFLNLVDLHIMWNC